MHCCGSKSDPSSESATVDSSSKERKEDDFLIEQKEINLNDSNGASDPTCNHQELLIFCDSCKRCSIEGHDIELSVCQLSTHEKKHGAMNVSHSFYTNPTLCYYCKKMFSSNSNNFDFRTWWAAWIHTMLENRMKNNTSPDDHSYFPMCLSDVLLKMWRHHPHVRQGVIMFVD